MYYVTGIVRCLLSLDGMVLYLGHYVYKVELGKVAVCLVGYLI